MKKIVDTDKDICRRVSEKLNIPYKKVVKVLDVTTDYIAHLTEVPDVMTIGLPYVGNLMFLNNLYLNDVMNKTRFGKKYKESKYVNMKKAKEKFDKIVETHRIKRELNINYYKPCYHKKSKFITLETKFNKVLVYEIEKLQNKYADEKNK